MNHKTIILITILLISFQVYSQDEPDNGKPFGVTIDFTIPPAFDISPEIDFFGKNLKPQLLNNLSLGATAHQRISYKTYVGLGINFENLFYFVQSKPSTTIDNEYTTTNIEIPLTFTYIPKGGSFKNKRRTITPYGFSVSGGGYYSFNNTLITELGRTSTSSNFGAQISAGMSFGKFKMQIVYKKDLTPFLNEEIASLKRNKIAIVASLPLNFL